MILTFGSSGAFVFSSFIAMSLSPLTLFTLCLLSLFKILSLHFFFIFSICCPRNLISRITFLIGKVEGVVCKVLTAVFFLLTKVTCGRFYPFRCHQIIILETLCPSGLSPHAPEMVWYFLLYVYLTSLPPDLALFPLLLSADFYLHFYFRALFPSLFSPFPCLSRRMLCLASCCKYCTVILCK